ncbi:hypothetical protein GJ744_000818 [Endocarpon pusillum]|uniref:Uncharacterized protein n=1 Tax=Endocarpon pusillum TaxID=364733 RepID=A0A8H7ATA3_9EURO|nr:hypothetical protein GJ744_000818 [Endocarpon pusillum]
MDYGWRYFSTYRLTKAALEEFLTKKFGDWNFYISETEGNRYRFWIQRDLTQAEEDEIIELRWKG